MTGVISVAVGHNNFSLEVVSPSPSIDGIAYPRVQFSTGDNVFFDGTPYALLKFPDIMTPASAVAALALFGLATPSVASGRVTIQLPDENKVDFSIYNATAVRWNYGETITYDLNDWYKTPVIRLRRLAYLMPAA